MPEKKQKKKRERRPFVVGPKPVPRGMKMSTFQRILRIYRVRRGLSRLALQEASGVFHRTIESWETEPTKSPQIFHATAVLDALGLELWVVDRSEKKLIDRIY